MKILSASQMKNTENLAMNIGLSEELLMENAGSSLYHVLKNTFDLGNKKVLILTGPGNNGGDGLVLARKLHANNIFVETLFTSGFDNYRGASKKNLDLLMKLGISQKNLYEIENLENYIKNFDIVVDGIFGIGLSKPIESPIRDLIETINNSKKYVLSIDLPSGIKADSGEILGIAIKASETLVLGRIKFGNLLYPGFSYCGKLHLDKISIQDSFTEAFTSEVNIPIEYEDRDENSHKGSFGKVLIVGGGKKYYGAPYLNSIAFLKSGGSYANLACPENLVGPLALKANEIVFYPLKETREGNISIENLKTILDVSENKDLVVIGGGFSQEEEPQRLINILTSKISKPLLIDADGIIALKDKLDVLYQRNNPTILTPHLGEFAKLINKTIEEIKSNLVEFAREFAIKYRIILVLKDSRTIIALPSGKIYLNTTGSSSLSVAGSGDILSGVIAGQFALGLNPEEAARMGVFIHGLTGNLLSQEMGSDGVMAEDIMKKLPFTMKYYRDHYKEIISKYSIEII